MALCTNARASILSCYLEVLISSFYNQSAFYRSLNAKDLLLFRLAQLLNNISNYSFPFLVWSDKIPKILRHPLLVQIIKISHIFYLKLELVTIRYAFYRLLNKYFTIKYNCIFHLFLCDLCVLYGRAVFTFFIYLIIKEMKFKTTNS